MKKSESQDLRSPEVSISALGRSGRGRGDIKIEEKVKKNVISFPIR